VCLVLPHQASTPAVFGLCLDGGRRRRGGMVRLGVQPSRGQGRGAGGAGGARGDGLYLYLVDEVTGEPVVGPGYPIEITPTPRRGSPSTRRSSRPGSRLWAWPTVRGSGLARCFFPGVPVIPAGARQAASSSAVAVGVRLERRAVWGAVCRRRAAGSGERRAAAGPKSACAERGAAGRSSRAFWRRARRGQGVWGPVPRVEC
jgi:hypothetical protein